MFKMNHHRTEIERVSSRYRRNALRLLLTCATVILFLTSCEHSKQQTSNLAKGKANQQTKQPDHSIHKTTDKTAANNDEGLSEQQWESIDGDEISLPEILLNLSSLPREELAGLLFVGEFRRHFAEMKPTPKNVQTLHEYCVEKNFEPNWCSTLLWVVPAAVVDEWLRVKEDELQLDEKSLLVERLIASPGLITGETFDGREYRKRESTQSSLAEFRKGSPYSQMIYLRHVDESDMWFEEMFRQRIGDPELSRMDVIGLVLARHDYITKIGVDSLKVSEDRKELINSWLAKLE